MCRCPSVYARVCVRVCVRVPVCLCVHAGSVGLFVLEGERTLLLFYIHCNTHSLFPALLSVATVTKAQNRAAAAANQRRRERGRERERERRGRERERERAGEERERDRQMEGRAREGERYNLAWREESRGHILVHTSAHKCPL